MWRVVNSKRAEISGLPEKDVFEGDTKIAELHFDWYGGGKLCIGDSVFPIKGKGVSTRRFWLTDDAAREIASLRVPTFKPTVLRVGDREFRLKSKGWSGRQRFELWENDRMLGSVRFGKFCDVNLPPEVPLPVRVFIIWFETAINFGAD